jgi:transposase
VVPVEKREEIVEAYENREGTIEAIAQRFSISPSTLKAWLERKRKTGSLEPTMAGRVGRKPVLDEEDRKFLSQLIGQRPSITIRELKDELAEVRDKDVSVETIRITLKRMGLVHKPNEDRRDANPAVQEGESASARPDNSTNGSEVSAEPSAAQEPTPTRYQDKDRREPEPVFFERTRCDSSPGQQGNRRLDRDEAPVWFEFPLPTGRGTGGEEEKWEDSFIRGEGLATCAETSPVICTEVAFEGPRPVADASIRPDLPHPLAPSPSEGGTGLIAFRINSL